MKSSKIATKTLTVIFKNFLIGVGLNFLLQARFLEKNWLNFVGCS